LIPKFRKINIGKYECFVGGYNYSIPRHIKIQVVIEDTEARVTEGIACLERKELSPETPGLTLEEGKKLLFNIQKTMV
jgi:hypothetical protein